MCGSSLSLALNAMSESGESLISHFIFRPNSIDSFIDCLCKVPGFRFLTSDAGLCCTGPECQVVVTAQENTAE